MAVSGHREVPGVTNIVLNHARAATLALEYLSKLGHSRMAFIKGQEFSSDTAVRWESVRNAAEELGIGIKESLVVQLEGESSSPELAYQVTHPLPRSLRSMIFPRSARFMPCGKPGDAFPRMFPWWVSMTFKARHSKTRR